MTNDQSSPIDPTTQPQGRSEWLRSEIDRHRALGTSHDLYMVGILEGLLAIDDGGEPSCTLVVETPWPTRNVRVSIDPPKRGGSTS